MTTQMNEKTGKKYKVALLVIWILLMLLAFFYCTKKQGFHEDEYYTYYSTARTNGFYVEDGQWMDRETYAGEFTVKPGEEFSYGLVKQVQSWDVHPPMYYFLFHTVNSFFPNMFSKWIGLSINLVLHGINLILFACLAYLVSKKDAKITLASLLFYGLTPACISGVTFIRMYEFLTTWVLLCAILHCHEMERHVQAHKDMTTAKNGRTLSLKQFLIPAAVVTYFGFLTQYYYFIFLFFMAVSFCVVLLWTDRKIRNCLYYGISQMGAFVLAYFTYPACLGQMFKGQRGAQATENFFDFSNTWSRLVFFYDILNKHVFGGYLPVILLIYAAVILAAVATRKGAKKNERGKEINVSIWMLAFCVLGYFVVVSKTALLYEGTSVRYQLPIYGMIVLLLFYGMNYWWQKKTDIIVLAALLLININNLAANRIQFLYPEDKEQVEVAREKAKEEVPVVYLYNDNATWCVWDVTNELLEYPEVYFATVFSAEPISDEKIKAVDSLMVYIAEGADVPAQIERIQNSNPQLTNCAQLFEEKYCSVYAFTR